MKKTYPMALLPLLTSLLLGSCNHSESNTPVASHLPGPAPVINTSQPKLSSLYEVQFKRSGQGQQLSSSIKALSPQLIRASAAPLTFNYASSGTLNINGQWYVRVTYNVTNNSSQPLSNLSFVPLDTDLISGTTSSIDPTVGASYFKDIQHFDGSDASDTASSLTPIQAVDSNGSPDATATPYVNVNTAGLSPSLPTGLVLGAGGLSAKGWQLSAPLAAGATAQVTFATQMPAVSGTADPFNYTVVVNAFSDVDVPVTLTPTAGANTRFDLPATTTSNAPAYVTGTIGDNTDPASTAGINFTVAASDADAAGLTVSASSSDSSVAAASLSGSGAQRTLTIQPQKVGKANITVTVTDGNKSASYIIAYAASSASGANSSTHYFSGISNASSVQDAGNGYMLVADDEFNFLSLYSRDQSGLRVKSFDFTPSLSLAPETSTTKPEMDLEASAQLGSRIFWLGSHSNDKKGGLQINRYRVFATDVTGSGKDTALSFVGHYDHLRDDLLAWDAANANALGLKASAAQGVIPESGDGSGFNIEGMAFAPNSSVAYLGFRAPLSTPSSRNLALIVPVNNLPDLVTGAASQATFGAPIQLDLGGRAIRELKCNAQGCLILAGPASGGSNFALYSWSGKPGDAAHLRNDLSALASSADGSFESIVNLPDVNPDSEALTGQGVQLVLDNGDAVYYGDGTSAKDLTPDWQKFRAETVAVGPMPTQTCTVSNVALAPASPALTVGTTQNLSASFTTSPANCAVTTAWTSSDSRVLSVSPSGVVTGNAAGSATVTATVTPSSGGSSSVASTTVTVSASPTTDTLLPNLAVYRVGTGAAKLTNAATPVYVDIYNPNTSALVSSLALPTTISGSNKPLTASGTAASEGLLSRSANGQYLVLTGYGATPGTATVASTTSNTTPRIIGRIDAAGNIDTSTALTDVTSGNNVRSATSVDGSSFYIAGSAAKNDGLRYAALGATTSSLLSSTQANLRQLNIFGDQLYATSGSGSNAGVNTVGSGAPTSGGQATTLLPGLSVTTNSYGFFMATLNSSNAFSGPDTLYVADGTSGLQKFSYDGTTWKASGAIAGALDGLSGAVINNQVYLFASNAAGSQLLKFVDGSGYGGTLSGAATTLASAQTNTAFRGVALAPQP